MHIPRPPGNLSRRFPRRYGVSARFPSLSRQGEKQPPGWRQKSPQRAKMIPEAPPQPAPAVRGKSEDVFPANILVTIDTQGQDAEGGDVYWVGDGGEFRFAQVAEEDAAPVEGLA